MASRPAPKQGRAAKRGAGARPATLRVVGGGTLAQQVASGAAPLAAIDSASPIERVEMVREGVPARLLTRLAEDMAIPKEKLYGTIGVKRATVDRKVRKQERLSAGESEGALGMARLIGQVESIVRESGDPEGFDAARWVAGWLYRPHPALGGRCPGDLMDTAEGRALVSGLVAQMQSGAYA